MSLPATMPGVPLGEPARRVSMADVARAAKVHRSTVSLALRHQARIPAATRERIIRVAETLGYSPDPLLDAFNFHRLAAHPRRASLAIAFVSDLESREAFAASDLHRESLLGARERAAQLGFSVDLLLTGPGQVSAGRLNQILQSRGISCLILAALGVRTTELALDWPRYCAVAIESFHVRPPLDLVTHAHRASARCAVRFLRRAGHRRIGFISSESEDRRLDHLPLSGYLLEARTARTTPLSPLLLRDQGGPAIGSAVASWLSRHSPTAVILGCESSAVAVRAGKLALPDRVSWTDCREFLGPAQSYRELGARTAELLPLRRQVNQCGIPAHRTRIILTPERPSPL